MPSRTKRDAHGCLVALSFRGKEVGHRFPGTLAQLLDSRTLAANSPYSLSFTVTCGMPRRYAEARNRVFQKRQFRTDRMRINALFKRSHNMSESEYGD